MRPEDVRSKLTDASVGAELQVMDAAGEEASETHQAEELTYVNCDDDEYLLTLLPTAARAGGHAAARDLPDILVASGDQAAASQWSTRIDQRLLISESGHLAVVLTKTGYSESFRQEYGES